MDFTNRINSINASEPSGESKIITYNGKSLHLPVLKIPLNLLLYNRYNGRIKSLTLSYEQQHHDLNPHNHDDIKIIEQFLYDSASNKNDKTIESLELKGQQEIGIVTNDGIIIDGNRRAMLLNNLARQGKGPGYLKAIVLPDNWANNKKEIVKLETNYQMGVDSKVEYNPIEKYLRCKELVVDFNFSITEVADIFSEAIEKIELWLNILYLMEEYLSFIGYDKIYTKLDKREGHFVDLFGYLNTYKNKSRRIAIWNYTQDDIDLLKKVYFIYIRLKIPVLIARTIAKPKFGNSFFANKEIWDQFSNEVITLYYSIKTPTIKAIKLENPQKSENDIIDDIDAQWENQISNNLNSIFSIAESKLKDITEKQAPVKLLKRALNTLSQVSKDTFVPENKNEILDVISSIELLSARIKEDAIQL